MATIAWRRDLLVGGRIRALSRRSDGRGLVQLGSHLAALAATAYLLSRALGSAWVVPAVIVHGVVLTFLFAPLHESIHYTDFRRRWLNEVVAGAAGAVLMLPPLYFRYFHFTHHRWTQDTDRDPEQVVPKPATLGHYLLVVSGVPYWRDRLTTTLRHAFGAFTPNRFLPAAATARIVAEARRLWALYALIAAVALATVSWAPVIYWVIPALVGQPALRLYLLAEHTGCALGSNMLVNSRTTLTNALVRRLAWNMPYHIEHHAFPSVPFHALPRLHDDIRDRLGVVAPGYVAVHADILRGLGHTARP